MRLSSIDNVLCAKSGRGSNFFSRYLLLFILLIFCVFQVNIHKIYGFSIYPDEFGYWACAACAVGYDWADAASLGSYYSFGYSLILTPILKIFKDSVTAYRAAISVNMLMQCVSVGMLCEIFKRWYLQCPSGDSWENLQKKRIYILFAVGCASFYPAWSFYVQTTLTEGLLTFLYVFICYQIVLFTEKPNMVNAVMLALSLLYLYFVHMRTVVIIPAALVTLLLFVWKNPSYRKLLITVVVILLIGAVCGFYLKESIINAVFAEADLRVLSVNDYAGQWEKIGKIFSMSGILKLFLSCIGKLYYLGIASYGLLYPALYCFGKETVCLFRGLFSKSENCKSRKYLSLFCLLSFVGQYMVTAINNIEPGRLDSIVYGRYNEYLLPVFIGVGLLVFCETEYKWREFFLSVVFTVILFGITFLNTLHSGLTAMQGYFSPGISYLSDDWHYNVAEEFVKAFLFGIFLMLFIRGCIWGVRRFRSSVSCLSVLAVILVLEILLTVCLQKKYTWLFNDVDYYNLQIYEYISEEEMPVSYLHEGGLPYIDLIQFAMRDKKIEVITLPEDNLPGDGFLIVNSDCAYLKEIGQKYKKCLESSTFCLFLAE